MHNIEVDTSLLIVSAGLKPGRQCLALAVTHTKTRKMQNSGNTNHKLESIPHTKARERFNIPVMQQTHESLCSSKGQGTSVCTSSKKQCSRHYTSQVPDLPDGDPHTVNTRERAPSPSNWQTPGLAAASPGHRVRKQIPQQIPCREKGKASPLGEQCARPVHVSQVLTFARQGSP